MKILFVHKDINQDINAGGINTVYLEHIKKLESTNNELFVITSRDGEWNLKAKRFVVSSDDEVRNKEIEKIIEEINPDIIDVFSWNAELLEYVKKPHSAKVIMRADIPMQYYNKPRVDEEMAAHCDKIISISNWCDFEWSAKVGGKTTVIPHACSILPKGNISKIKNTVVWIGKCTDIKGIDLLLKLPDEFYKKFKLVVVCAPTRFDDAELFKKLEEKGAEIRRNLSNDKYRELLQESEFVLSTARREGFCIAVLEGMRLGCIPVIPYWIGGTTDFVNNENGIVYCNFDECYERMNNLSDNDKKNLMNESINTAIKYNWDYVTELSIEEYRKLQNER